MSEMVKAVWQKYLSELELHPLRTKAITAGVLGGCSDIVSQKISGIKKIQFRRLLFLMLYGFAYGGPLDHFYDKLVDAVVKGKKSGKTIAKKVLLEQLIYSPWANWCYMMYFELVVEGRAWSSVKNTLRKDFPAVQLVSWKFWPIVGWINYQYIPLQLRVLVYCLLDSCWSIFLSLKARSSAIKKA